MLRTKHKEPIIVEVIDPPQIKYPLARQENVDVSLYEGNTEATKAEKVGEIVLISVDITGKIVIYTVKFAGEVIITLVEIAVNIIKLLSKLFHTNQPPLTHAHGETLDVEVKVRWRGEKR